MQQYPLKKLHWEQSSAERSFHNFEKEVQRLKYELEEACETEKDGKPENGKALLSERKVQILKALNLQLKKMESIGDLEARLDKFKNQKPKNTMMAVREKHWLKHDSRRLGKNLCLAGKPKPDDKCHAHAIVAGGDPSALKTRALLMVMGIRVDDPANGVWLPGYEKDLPHWAMPNAVAHAWLNHPGYHDWIADIRFGGNLIESTDISKGRLVIAILQKTALMLQSTRDKVPASAIKKKPSKP